MSRVRSSPLRIISAAALFIALVAVISNTKPAGARAAQNYPFEGVRKHLYVSDAGGHVFLLPFLSTGVPSPTPEATLNAGVGPIGLAFDSHNDLYVSSQNSGDVRIFAPGRHGATRLINTFNFGGLIETIEVGPDDYVYVVVDPISGGSFINIYPPGIGDPNSPIAVISSPAAAFGDFTLDRTGALYVRTTGDVNIIVYSHPRISQVPDGIIAPPNGYYLYDNYGGIAVDRDNQLRFEVHTDNPEPWGNADFVVHALDGNRPDRLILTRDCTGQNGYPGLGDGAAVRQPYLFYACSEYGVVLVYRADDFGRQPLIMAIGGSGPIQQANNVIVGI